MPSVHLDDITISYDDAGEGDPLVLVHGHPFDRTMWQPQIEHFGRSGWRVIAADLRGYGRTTVVPGSTPLERFARDVLNLIDHLGIGRIVLGGLSMGGQIVMDFYRQFPERVRALILADTSARAETPEGRTARYEMADRLLREGMTRYADEVLPKMIAPRAIEARPALARYVLRMMRDAPAAGAAAALRGRAERPDYTEVLTRVSVPTLVVVGGEDEFTPISDAEHMMEHLPKATLRVIDEAAHMPNLERPDEFNNAMDLLLAEVVA